MALRRRDLIDWQPAATVHGFGQLSPRGAKTLSFVPREMRFPLQTKFIFQTARRVLQDLHTSFGATEFQRFVLFCKL